MQAKSIYSAQISAKMFRRRPQVGGDLAGQLFCQARLTSLTDDVVQPGCDLVRCVVRIMMIRIAADMNHCGSRSAH
jgi:hypothetical protein